MRRRTGCIAWLVIIAAVAALFLAWQYLSFRSTVRTLPAGMTMAGLSVEGMTREQALNALDVAFATPIEIACGECQEEPLALPPRSISLRHDAEETTANLDRVLSAQEGLEGFIGYVLRRPSEPVDVPVAVSYSQEQLDGFLARVAMQCNRPPQEPVPLPASLTFRAGQTGCEVDVEASRARLAAALVSATEQQAELVVRTEEAPAQDLDILGEMLQSLLDDYANLTPGVFVKDLQTGDELGINAEVAYSGLSVLKIAVLEETYRSLDLPLDIDVNDWLSDTIGVTSSNYKANLLLRDVIGNGDAYQGAENLTTSMHHLGLKNTFMVAPYEEQSSVTIATPANSRTDVTTEPDPNMQTTPLDIGLLLEMIYQCHRGGGALLVAYPGDLTADECNQMIEWMSMNRTDSMIEVGVPVETTVAHKHGFTGDTHADAALVFSPGGDFVLVVYLYRPQWLEWEASAPLIADIATATYNYFNPAQ